MEIILTKKPKNARIVQGFPGYGLVGSICTEFMIEHLECELIGRVILDEGAPVVAIHNSKYVEPFGIYYNKQHNIIILHIINKGIGLEWLISDLIGEIVQQLTVKELITLEGVASQDQDVYYFSEHPKNIKQLSAHAKELTEGVLMGVTAGLLVKKPCPITCIFVGTHNDYPDSLGASKVLETLNAYLKLGIDPKPLEEKAKEFEEKLKNILSKSADAEQKHKERLSYLG